MFVNLEIMRNRSPEPNIISAENEGIISFTKWFARVSSTLRFSLDDAEDSKVKTNKAAKYIGALNSFEALMNYQ